MEEEEWYGKYIKERKGHAKLKFSTWNKEKLINHIIDLRLVIDELKREVQELTPASIKEKSQLLSTNRYRQNWPYTVKLKFLIALNRKPLTSNDLYDILMKMDDQFRTLKSPNNVLLVTLNRSVEYEQLKKIKVPGKRSLYYFLPEWIDNKGNIKKNFGEEIKKFHYE